MAWDFHFVGYLMPIPILEEFKLYVSMDIFNSIPTKAYHLLTLRTAEIYSTVSLQKHDITCSPYVRQKKPRPVKYNRN
jgi:hypothetical protein